MAPLPIIEDTFRIALKWGATNMVNVIHIHDSARTAPQIATLLASTVKQPMWQSNTTFAKITQVDITPLGTAAGTLTYMTDGSAKWGGTQSGEHVTNCAAVISFKTMFRGPANRGRLYLGPLSEASLANGLVVDASRTGLAAAWATFGADLIAASAEHVVASYVHSTALTVVGWSVRPAAGTQRRRQDRLAH